MKKYLVFAAAASLFAACSNDDGAVAGPQQEAQQTAGEVAVGFDAYVNRATTRAGLPGELKNEASGLQKTGFGVFAYYTNADNYDQSFTPNFMYNQHVTYKAETTTPTAVAAHWEYTPVKYWPNEFGTGASSEDVDKVSFFAYAPYVSVNPTSGKVNGTQKEGDANYTGDNGDITMGIVGMTNNSTTGDPMVKYISTFYTDKQVDLTWGTVPSSSATWALKNTGDQTLNAYKPWLDIQHPSATTATTRVSTQPVKFNFIHALAALNVTVDTKTNGTAVAAPATGTKVYIRSVTFEGFDVKGALNLNNTKVEETGSPAVASAAIADWYNFDCLSELNNGSEITIQDGRKDGKEGVTAATKENAFINPTFVQSTVWGVTGATDGVTGTPANLFKAAGATAAAQTDPIYVIPNNDPLKVTIEYDVLTQDDNLAGTLNDGQTKGSVVKNVITRYITVGEQGKTDKPTDIGGTTSGNGIALENGKKYTIKLHLGLNSVEFDAAVEPWATGLAGGADLPHNN